MVVSWHLPQSLGVAAKPGGLMRQPWMVASSAWEDGVTVTVPATVTLEGQRQRRVTARCSTSDSGQVPAATATVRFVAETWASASLMVRYGLAAVPSLSPM